MISARSLGPKFVLGFIILLSFLSGPSLQAQLCDPVSCWFVSLNCGTGATTCVNGTCVCVLPCNNNDDCRSTEFCGSAGRCVSGAPCNSNAGCTSSERCISDRGICAPCSVVGCPPPSPCTNASCDDGNPCNGVETCDGTGCQTGRPVSCDDRNGMTVDVCVADSATSLHCDHNTDRKGSCSAVSITGSSVRFPHDRSGAGRGFVWSGTVKSGLSGAAPFDLQNSTIRVVLVDQAGHPMFDHEIAADPSAWKRASDGALNYSNGDSKSSISKIAFQAAGKELHARTFEVRGTLNASSGISAKGFRATGALVVDWTGDISGPCGKVTMPFCSERSIGGEPQMVCRERSISP